jgi:F-type H+-transporting ATPase subunit gamma
MILITSDRGLCGPLNSSLFKATQLAESQWRNQGKEISYITVGRKGSDYIRRNNPDALVASHHNLNVPTPRYEGAQTLAENILKTLEEKKYSRCFLYYNRFVSAIQQKVEEVSLLPLGGKNSDENLTKDHNVVIEYEPNAEDLLKVLLPKALETTLYTSLLESFASEQGARMTAMDSANRNAGDMIDKLTITYNRSRQANITNELIEVISGAAAV